MTKALARFSFDCKSWRVFSASWLVEKRPTRTRYHWAELISASTINASNPLLFNLSCKSCAAEGSLVAEICTDQVLADRSFFAASATACLAPETSGWLALTASTSRLFLALADLASPSWAVALTTWSGANAAAFSGMRSPSMGPVSEAVSSVAGCALDVSLVRYARPAGGPLPIAERFAVFRRFFSRQPSRKIPMPPR